MYIRPDGHGASFSAEVTAEEAVYTLRRMLGNPFWCEKIEICMKNILSLCIQYFEEEQNLIDKKIAPIISITPR